MDAFSPAMPRRYALLSPYFLAASCTPDPQVQRSLEVVRHLAFGGRQEASTAEPEHSGGARGVGGHESAL